MKFLTSLNGFVIATLTISFFMASCDSTHPIKLINESNTIIKVIIPNNSFEPISYDNPNTIVVSDSISKQKMFLVEPGEKLLLGNTIEELDSNEFIFSSLIIIKSSDTVIKAQNKTAVSKAFSNRNSKYVLSIK